MWFPCIASVIDPVYLGNITQRNHPIIVFLQELPLYDCFKGNLPNLSLETYRCDKEKFLKKQNNGVIYHSKCVHVHAWSYLTFYVHVVFQARNTGVGCCFLSPGHLPKPGIESTSLASPALLGGFKTTVAPGKPITLRGITKSVRSIFK